MKDYAKAFYSSKAWQRRREQHKQEVGGLCECCLARGIITPGEIVHHIVPITPMNINDPSITMARENLELVCRECHADRHAQRSPRRFKVDEFGRVTGREIAPPARKKST